MMGLLEYCLRSAVDQSDSIELGDFPAGSYKGQTDLHLVGEFKKQRIRYMFWNGWTIDRIASRADLSVKLVVQIIREGENT